MPLKAMRYVEVKAYKLLDSTSLTVPLGWVRGALTVPLGWVRGALLP